jgi:hypothetical protein
VTHLPFIAASYALGILLPLAFAADAFRRTGQARRKLGAIDPRAQRSASRRKGRQE